MIYCITFWHPFAKFIWTIEARVLLEVTIRKQFGTSVVALKKSLKESFAKTMDPEEHLSKS